jgi:hypothetical protein
MASTGPWPSESTAPPAAIAEVSSAGIAVDERRTMMHEPHPSPNCRKHLRPSAPAHDSVADEDGGQRTAGKAAAPYGAQPNCAKPAGPQRWATHTPTDGLGGFRQQ